MASQKQPLPERPRRYRFALTPLADAMFQLLIFFMLSTSLTPYSLITLKSAPADTVSENQAQGAGDASSETSPPRPTSAGDVALWTIGNGVVRAAGGMELAIEQVSDLAEAFSTQDNPASVVLIIEESARVQDVAYALEALENANVGSVQITRDGA
ncbi:MAG: biopolymer transporter ExbD [Rhodobacteraceae bacterium]|nr:biopolymer transporter ExbD [Paracoccaceae bacterium]